MVVVLMGVGDLRIIDEWMDPEQPSSRMVFSKQVRK
jgi:hypothetical protein